MKTPYSLFSLIFLLTICLSPQDSKAIPPTSSSEPISGREIVLPQKKTLHLDLAELGVKPGDSLIIPTGSYSGITLMNFKGTAEHPIVIKNAKEGRVTSPYFRIHKATHFVISGSGSTNQYGFLLGSKSSNACLSISDETSDFEVERTECIDATCGFLFKVNPHQNNPLTIHPNWVMDNIKIHDNYIHHVHGEGMYIGHTGHNGGQSKNPLIPVRLNHVKIYNNLVENTDWDGIQLAAARDEAEIHHNTIRNYGVINKATQQAGIILGGCTSGKIHDNWIENGTGNGIEYFGYGSGEISNNTLINAGIEKNDTIFINQVPNKVENDPPLSITVKDNKIIQKSNVAIKNANYHKNETSGKIVDNKIWLTGETNDVPQIQSNAKDLIENNTFNPDEKKPGS